MKRYILFSGERYYPKGGMEDFKFQSQSLIDCYRFLVKERKANKELRWANIFDIIEMKYKYINKDFYDYTYDFDIIQQQFLKD